MIPPSMAVYKLYDIAGQPNPRHNTSLLARRCCFELVKCLPISDESTERNPPASSIAVFERLSLARSSCEFNL